MMDYSKIVQNAQTLSRNPKYLPEASADIALVQSLVISTNEETSRVEGLIGVLVSAEAANTPTFSGDGYISAQTLITTPSAGFYRVDVVHLVSSTTAATGIEVLTIGWTDAAGATTATPAASLSLSALGRQSGSVSFYANAATTITWKYDITGFTTGTVTTSIQIKLTQVA